MEEEVRIRVDKFLKETRIIPRRTVAKAVIENGNVLINEKTAKPSTLVKDGDLIKLFIKGVILIVKVSFERQGKKLIVHADLVDRVVGEYPQC